MNGRICGDRRGNTAASKIRDTTPVDKYLKGVSPTGALEMSGNVWEWTSTGSDKYKVLRGGCWNSLPYDARCASRHWVNPDNTFDIIGFRCART